jgi:septal ring factor EnvC (AmiA/AmiB activator)
MSVELLTPAREAVVAEMARLKERITKLQTELIRAQTEFSVLEGRLKGLNEAAELLNHRRRRRAKLVAE